jgi:HprK-related kinase A
MSVLKLSDLGEADLESRLTGPGLGLKTGPFTLRIKTKLPHLVSQLHLLYSHYPLVASDEIVDFHIEITGNGFLRRWWRPQAVFLLDGDKVFEPFPASHAFPLLEWGVNWCTAMMAHQYLMLHAATVEKGGRALLFPAWPGAGKTTLCAALVSRGWRLFSDEFGLVQPGTGMLVPSPRPLPLKNRSIRVIREFNPDAVIGPEFPNTRKGTVAHLCPNNDSIMRSEEPAQPAWIVFPRYKSGAPMRLESVAKPQAFLKLTNNSFNYRLLGLAGFEAATRLVRECQCYVFYYSDLDEAVSTLDELITRA